MSEIHSPIAVVLGGGGARAAYQVGFLRYLARQYPHLELSIICGTSAGAINAAHLARHQGSLLESVEELSQLWRSLTVDQVFRVNSASLLRGVFNWGLRLISGGSSLAPATRGMVDTSPLREFLQKLTNSDETGIPGVGENLASGRLYALAVTTTDYGTGQSVTWVQGNGSHLWRRPNRRGVNTEISIDHVLASTALPLFFPAVNIDGAWHGDGGVRQTAPLSPALHLGAQRILAVSTRYLPSQPEAEIPVIRGYPPPVQVAGVLMNAVFLDALEADSNNLSRLNHFLGKIPEEERESLRQVRLMTTRPSMNLGRLAAEFEPKLPGPFRFLERGLGTQETKSPDYLSMLLFQNDYIGALIDLGEKDAEIQGKEIKAFVEDGEIASPHPSTG